MIIDTFIDKPDIKEKVITPGITPETQKVYVNQSKTP